MKRGDVVTVAVQGDFGKPRPALIIQADQFGDHASVTVLLMTSSFVDAPMLRVPVLPGGKSGVQRTSQVMIDKTMTIRRDKLGQVVGSLEDDVMVEVERRLAIFLGIAK
ncbi:MAG: type II toxin-antitoxin system PemK/MazF family toxin [Betaproteobacteria bacterium]|jgi:mRNA interferase MazF